jgi:type 1 glutamine amidotransferase
MKRIDFAAICGALFMVGTIGAGRPAETTSGAPAAKPIRVLLVLGGCCHEYDKQKEVLASGISARANVNVTIAYDPDTGTTHLNPVYDNADWAKDFDVVIHDECTSDMKELVMTERILAPHKNGLPAVILHCGEHTFRGGDWPKSTPWFDFTGVASTAHGPQVPIEVTYLDKDSPITKGFENWTTINEEMYNNSAGKLLDTAHALAGGKQVIKNRSGDETTANAVVVWTNNYNGKAKVFATTLGHNTATVGDPRYLDLVTRGLLWSVGKLTNNGKPTAGYAAK